MLSGTSCCKVPATVKLLAVVPAKDNVPLTPVAGAPLAPVAVTAMPAATSALLMSTAKFCADSSEEEGCKVIDFAPMAIVKLLLPFTRPVGASV